jgi:DME family drug/metabolite transporter
MKGQWLVLIAAVLWGTTGTAQALLPAGVDPLEVGAIRLLVGGSALLLLTLARGGLRGGRRWPFWPTALAALSTAAYQLFFFGALLRTGVAVGTVVAIGSAPVFSGALAVVWEREQPGRRWLGATLLAIAGCALLVTAGRALQVDAAGIGLAAAAGFAYALYALTSKRLLSAGHTPDQVISVVFFLAAVISLPLLFRSELAWLGQPRGLAVAAHLGLLATALAYALFIRGLTRVPSATAVSLSLAEPLTAGALGLLLLGERLTTVAALGLAALLVGTILLASAPTQQGGPASR